MKTVTTAALVAVNLPQNVIDELKQADRWINSCPTELDDLEPISDRFWDRYQPWMDNKIPQPIHDQLKKEGLSFSSVFVDDKDQLHLDCLKNDPQGGEVEEVRIAVYPSTGRP